MKKLKKWLSFLMLIVILTSGSAVIMAKGDNDTNIIESYEYPISNNDPEWATFKTTKEMIAACRIPKDILSSMSTEALVQAVLDYPLLINLHAYNDYKYGLKALMEQCDAYAMLLTKPDASIKLYNKLIQMNQAKETPDMLQELSLMVILSDDSNIINSLSTKEINRINELIDNSSYSLPRITIRTPNGTPVDLYHIQKVALFGLACIARQTHE